MIPASPPSYYFDTNPQPSLTQSAITTIAVSRAVYGTINNGYDVTAICQAFVNQGALVNGQSGSYQISFNNQTFGGDPDFGNTKYFAMQYSVNGGSPQYIGGYEGQTLTLPTS